MSKTRIGIFGGSFDPPTKGHLHIAEHLLDSDVVDEVMFVPAYKSYSKTENRYVGIIMRKFQI